MISLTPSELDRFWSKVNRTNNPDDCWIWTASLTKKGYGNFNLRRLKIQLAHRAAYLIANGELPNNLLVCHTCDNPPCCNPNHLFLGTIQDNSDDCSRKGRQCCGQRRSEVIKKRFVDNPDLLRGVNNPQAKLTEDQVREIRRLYASAPKCNVRNKRMSENGLTNLSRRFGVSISVIKSVVSKTTWKHVV